jgi:hypothetical protein
LTNSFVLNFKDQEKQDAAYAHSLSDRSGSANYQNLTGFYKKEQENEWKVKVAKSKNSKKVQQPKETTPMLTEDSDLQVTHST